MLYSLVAYLLPLVSATALTYKLTPNEKACFFSYVDEKGAKLAFYFAVTFPHPRPPSSHTRPKIYKVQWLMHTLYQVQSGGSFDVDYSVIGPGDKIIMSSEKERQGDFVFTAKETGEYRFCFDNDMSTFAEKLVDFEIAVWSPFTMPLLFAFPMRWLCQNIGTLLLYRSHSSAYRGDCHSLTSSLYLRAQ